MNKSKKTKDLKINFKTGGEAKKHLKSMTNLEIKEYVSKYYIPEIENISASLYLSGKNYFFDSFQSLEDIYNHYEKLSDYTETSLDKQTDYRIDNWDILKKEIDDETGEVAYENVLDLKKSDNTYNHDNLGVSGLFNLNYKLFYDKKDGIYFYAINLQKTKDVLGDYFPSLIIKDSDLNSLEDRLNNNFIKSSFDVSVYFKNGDNIIFSSDFRSKDSHFYIKEKSVNEAISNDLINDFKNNENSSVSDIFVKSLLNAFYSNLEKPNKENKFSSESPTVYVKISGTEEGKWFDVLAHSNGKHLISEIEELADGNEYEFINWSGFGKRYFSKKMNQQNFDSVFEAWDSFNNHKFPISIVEEYMDDTRNNDMDEVLKFMDKKFIGVFNDYSDFGKKIVKDGSYKISDSELFVSENDKKILAKKQSKEKIDEMSFDEVLIYSKQKDNYNLLVSKGDKITNDIIASKKEVSILEDNINSLENDSDKDEDSIDAISDLLVDYNDELDSLNKKIKELKKSLSKNDKLISDKKHEAYEISLSKEYDKALSEIEKNPRLYAKKKGFEHPIDSGFVSADFDAIGRVVSNNYLSIEDDNNRVYLFNNKGGSNKKLSVLNPTLKYNYFIIDLDSNKIVFGSESKSEIEDKKSELLKNNKSYNLSVYKRDYAKRRLNIDVDNASNWLELNNNSSKISINKIEKKSMGGWLSKQWFEADFGDGVGATRFFKKGGGIDVSDTTINIDIFGYKTKNFDICPKAVDIFLEAKTDIEGIGEEGFEDLYSMGVRNKGEDIDNLIHSAKFLDAFFEIEKTSISNKKTTRGELNEALINLLFSQSYFSKINSYKAFSFSTQHVINIVKGLDKSELKFDSGGKVTFDHEGDMAKSELQKIEKYAKYLNEKIKTDTQLMAWVQSKISRMSTDMGDVKHYMEYQLNNKKALGGIVIGGISVLIGALSVYFINKYHKDKLGGNKLHTRRGWVQDQKRTSKQKYELSYQKKKSKK